MRTSKKQKAVLLAFHNGKTIAETSKALGIKKQSLYNIRHRMRVKGIKMERQWDTPLPLSPAQRIVLYAYMQKKSIPDIAKGLEIRCQTVMNLASEGFKRLGLTVKGVDRIAALKAFFPMMDDPAFN